MSEIQLISDNIMNACCPEDVFGGGDIKSAFHRLANACHPDKHKDAIAKETFQRLNELKRIADDRVKDGQWGKRIPLPHCVPMQLDAYSVKLKPLVGDIADVYVGEGNPIMVKVARSHDDNDLMRAEAYALKTFGGIKGPVREGVPVLRSSFRIDGRWKREANVIQAFPGFFTAQQVRSKMTIDARTAVWMFKRILSLLTWVHHFKLVHGAILPSHVMFYPDNDGKTEIDTRKHSIRLIDWCYSVDFTKRTRLSSWVPAWKDHYAPELLAKSSIGPYSDIYMAARLIQYLLDASLPSGLRKVLDKCLHDDPSKRYQKAKDVMDDWIQAAHAEYGSPKWIDFNLPK